MQPGLARSYGEKQPSVTTREIRIGQVKLGELMRRIEEQPVCLRAVNSLFEIYNLGHLAKGPGSLTGRSSS